MSDDWSLDGKLRQCDPSKAVKILGKPIRHYFYGPNDIETLRQKLIEDLTESSGEVYHYLADEDRLLAIRTIKEIINKRFGVKNKC